MSLFQEHQTAETRRHFFTHGGLGLGTAALGSLLQQDSAQAMATTEVPAGLDRWLVAW